MLPICQLRLFLRSRVEAARRQAGRQTVFEVWEVHLLRIDMVLGVGSHVKL